MKYNIDETKFEKIDTEEKAYWLGFIYADGNVYESGKYKTKVLNICLSHIDKEHLYKFCSFLKTKKPLYFRKKLNQYSIHIWNIKIYNDLYKLGVIPNKTPTLRFPKINDNLKRHFIRGYFDGDGWISYNNKKITSVVVGMISSLSFIKDIKKEMKKFKLIIPKSSIKSYQSYKNKKYASICSYGYNNVKFIYEYFYKNSNIFLKRKHDKFCEFFKIHYENQKLNLKRKKYKEIWLEAPNGDIIQIDNSSDKNKYLNYEISKQSMLGLVNGISKNRSGWKLNKIVKQ